MHRETIERMLAAIVALFLAGTAAAKVAWMLGAWGRASAGWLPAYWAAAAMEASLVGLILWPRARLFGLSLTFWGFTGAALVSSAILTWGPDSRTCHCLGAPPTTQGTALMLQGGVMVLTGVALAFRAPREEVGGGHPAPADSVIWKPRESAPRAADRASEAGDSHRRR